MLEGEEPGDEHDASLRNSVDYALRVLLEYAKALRSVRESGLLDYKTYPFGM